MPVKQAQKQRREVNYTREREQFEHLMESIEKHVDIRASITEDAEALQHKLPNTPEKKDGFKPTEEKVRVAQEVVREDRQFVADTMAWGAGQLKAFKETNK